MELVKIVIYAPLSHADLVRQTLGEAGAGELGNYRFCSFSVRGVGRFLPTKDATPAIGEPGTFEAVEEERIEVVCPKEIARKAIEAVRAVHPYEEMAYEVYPLLNNVV